MPELTNLQTFLQNTKFDFSRIVEGKEFYMNNPLRLIIENKVKKTDQISQLESQVVNGQTYYPIFFEESDNLSAGYLFVKEHNYKFVTYNAENSPAFEEVDGLFAYLKGFTQNIIDDVKYNIEDDPEYADGYRAQLEQLETLQKELEQY